MLGKRVLITRGLVLGTFVIWVIVRIFLGHFWGENFTKITDSIGGGFAFCFALVLCEVFAEYQERKNRRSTLRDIQTHAERMMVMTGTLNPEQSIFRSVRVTNQRYDRGQQETNIENPSSPMFPSTISRIYYAGSAVQIPTAGESASAGPVAPPSVTGPEPEGPSRLLRVDEN